MIFDVKITLSERYYYCGLHTPKQQMSTISRKYKKTVYYCANSPTTRNTRYNYLYGEMIFTSKIMRVFMRDKVKYDIPDVEKPKQSVLAA